MVLNQVLLNFSPSISPFPHEKHYKEEVEKASIKDKPSVIFPIKISLGFDKVNHTLI